MSQGGGPPSRGSSADADDRTPPPQLPPSPFVPPDKFPSYSFNMATLTDPALAGKYNRLNPCLVCFNMEILRRLLKHNDWLNERDIQYLILRSIIIIQIILWYLSGETTAHNKLLNSQPQCNSTILIFH